MSVRKGFTLLEVLISAMVIMVGILGVATLIPASKFQINEAVKADMAAMIGRSALKTMITQNWMACLSEDLEGGLPSYVIPYPKNQTYWFNASQGEVTGYSKEEVMVADFQCTCDLVPDPSRYTVGEEPPYYDITRAGKFKWSGTIRKIDQSYCEISAAVSYQRGKGNSFVECSGSLSNYGVDLSISESIDYEFKLGEWIYISPSSSPSADSTSRGHWYKIIQLAGDGNVLYLTLQGPVWNTTGNNAVAVTVATPGNVIAVYTEVVPYGLR